MFRLMRYGAAAVALAVAFVLSASTIHAQPSTPTSMSIGARVTTPCRIVVDDTVGADSPSVRVVCARESLRALRVTTDRGQGLEPVTTFAGSVLKAGGEVLFTVPIALATVASTLPVIVPPTSAGRGPITVTLDF